MEKFTRAAAFSLLLWCSVPSINMSAQTGVMMAQNTGAIAFADSSYFLKLERFEASDFSEKVFDPASIDRALLNACVFHFTNKYRMSRGLSSLHHDASLEKAADFHSAAMMTQRFFAHENPKDRNCRTPAGRAKKFGFSGKGVGENITLIHLQPNATYFDIAKAIVQSWIDSPPHRKNMLHRQYAFLGCGVAADAEFQKKHTLLRFYATQCFGG